jgi:L-iditol 2-dehydrogenase
MEQAHPGDVVAIVGQGLVGSLMLQVLLATSRARVIAIDALESRCELAAKLGAHEVINARTQDPVQAVKRVTNGIGADTVAYAVGGPAGPKAFDQGLEMLASGGLMHLIGLYEDGPLPLSSSKIQGKRLIGGYVGETVTARTSRLAIDLLATGAIRTELLTTHRFWYGSAAEAYDLLHNRPGDALGVLLDWET